MSVVVASTQVVARSLIELRILGPIDLTTADSVSGARVLSQPKRLALLAYLAAATPHGFHRRDTILTLLWPELDQGHARAALRNTLHFLRRELGDQVIVTRGDTVGIDPLTVWCDAAEFDLAIKSNAPERALALYRGHLLDGLHVSDACEFERWVDGERDRLRRCARDAAYSLALTQDRAGHPGVAAGWARASLDLYPDDESCLQLLLRLLDGSGDRASALSEYERFSRRLWAEHDSRPSPETVRLVEKIRSRNVRLTTGPQSVVVLPFENLGPAEDGQRFSDGLVEEIIIGLSGLPSLRVIARSSSARLEGTAKDVRTIGRELGVEYAIEGSVRRDSENLRVAARVVEAASCSVVWSETYAGTLSDLFDIQERLTRAIAAELHVAVGTASINAARSKYNGSIIAYECYHRAALDLHGYSQAALDRALRHVHNGLDLVGENALLLAAAAYGYLNYVELGIRPDPRYLDTAAEYARRSLSINPNLALGHAALGMVKYKRGDLEGAVVDLWHALEADRNQPEALLRLALIYLIGGNEAAAGPLIDRLLAVDPLTPVNHCLPGYALLLQGDIEGAIPAYRRMYEMEPDSPVTRWFYSLVLCRCGRELEAIEFLEGILHNAPGTTFARHSAFLKHALQGDRASAVACATPELQDEARWDQHASWWMASTYSVLREHDAALDWLANATKLGYINYPFLSRIDPCLDSVRADARFWSLMEQLRPRWEQFVQGRPVRPNVEN